MQGSHLAGGQRAAQATAHLTLQALQELQKAIRGAIADRFASGFLKILQSLLFHRQVCLNVRMSGRRILVSEPKGDHSYIHASLQ
jgi:hypothetical protein